MAIIQGGPSIHAAHIPFSPPASVARPVTRRPAPARPAPTVVPPVVHPSYTAPQEATIQANQALAPSLAAQNAFNARQNMAITAFSKALLGQLTPIAGQVGSAYDQAIQQTGDLSSRAADYLQNANPNPQVQGLLSAISAPQAQQDQISQNLANTFGGGAGVLAFTGGAIPGGQLAADKAASVAQAAQLPGIAALTGQQQLASALGTQTDARNQLLATRPQLYQSALQNIRTNQNARATAAQTAKQNAFDNTLKVKEFNQGVRDSAEKIREFKINRADALAAAKTAEADKRAASVAKTAADKAAAQRQAKIDFLNFYSKHSNETISHDSWVSIAKTFGIPEADVKGLSTSAPTAPLKQVTINGARYNENPDGSVSLAPGSPPPKKPAVSAPKQTKINGAVYDVHPDGSISLAPGSPPPTPPKKTTPTPHYRPGFQNGQKGTWRVKPDGSIVPGSFVASSAKGGATTKEPKVSLGLSRQTGKWVDSSGRAVPSMAGFPPPTSNTSPKDLSAMQERIKTETARINNGLSAMFNGKAVHKDPITGTTTYLPAIKTRAGALAELKKEGYLSSPELKRIALARLNVYYPVSKGVTVGGRGAGGLGVTASSPPSA